MIDKSDYMSGCKAMHAIPPPSTLDQCLETIVEGIKCLPGKKKVNNSVC